MALIVIEGLDGAGKSTQINLLCKYFEQKGIATQFLHFPRVENPFFGELIAKFLRGEMGKIDQVDPYVVALLYATDRMDAAKEINQWIAEGKIVLLDRYVYSNIAFQCAKIEQSDKREYLRKWIFELEFEKFAIPRPSLNIFLDVPFDFTRKKLTENRLGESRNYLKGKNDIHESDLNFQQLVREVYIDQQNYDSNFKVIDCASVQGTMLSPNEIHGKVVELVKTHCNNLNNK